MTKPVVNTDECTGCGMCTDECPMDVLEVIDNVAVANGDDCTGCESCVDVCPMEAILIEA